MPMLSWVLSKREQKQKGKLNNTVMVSIGLGSFCDDLHHHNDEKVKKWFFILFLYIFFFFAWAN